MQDSKPQPNDETAKNIKIEPVKRPWASRRRKPESRQEIEKSHKPRGRKKKEPSNESGSNKKTNNKRKQQENDKPKNIKRQKILSSTIESDADFPKFEVITANIYRHRARRKLEEEDIPVCHCFNIMGETSCGDNCVNRLMSVECLRGHCPCGESCTNQRFQRANHPKVSAFKTQSKGWGLRVDEDLKAGQFIAEYVGEVITTELCETRLKKHKNEIHFYFLTLDANECIDARKKGNLARFINHSCNPNCQTRKWTVEGELRVGIFALRDIVAGTELTFDYQFERFGPKKQKCYCGESNCRGYLGAKPKHFKKLELPSTPAPTTSNLSLAKWNKLNKTLCFDPKIAIASLFDKASLSLKSNQNGVRTGYPVNNTSVVNFPFLVRNVLKLKQQYKFLESIWEEEYFDDLLTSDEES